MEKQPTLKPDGEKDEAARKRKETPDTCAVKRRMPLPPSRLGIVLALVGMTWLFLQTNPVRWMGLRMAARMSDEITLANATSFLWDEAYVEDNAYSDGRELKEKYGLSFWLESMGHPQYDRILYFNRGRLVKVLTYQGNVLIVGGDVGRITPFTRFSVQWDKNGKVYLTPVEDALG